MSLSCEQVGPLIEAFRDGLLEGRERELVAVHVAGCSACADEELVFALSSELFPAHTIEPRAVAREGRWRSRIVPRAAWPTRRHAWPVAAAGLLFLAVLSLRTSSVQPELRGTMRDGAGPSPRKHTVDERPAPVGLEIISAESVTLATSASRSGR